MTRAEPLAPDLRRIAIVEAVLPLLRQKGSTVTTREMAEAAGVAEGTIFGVFPDKCALIHEAIRFTMDPGPIEDALAALDPEAPLHQQLVEAGRIMLVRIEEVVSLMTILATMPTGHDHPHTPPAFVAESQAAVTAALRGLFARHEGQLTIDPARAAVAFRGLLFAVGHPMVAAGEKLTVEEAVWVLLNGILAEDLEPAR
ncbi:MAG TPA: TetR/AcrR family transcriptional regulator [Acidimicrobiia bacterium]|nr:TetR/AcrR family transcriptional regulator [Acidimicrobiia bacterium]